MGDSHLTARAAGVVAEGIRHRFTRRGNSRQNIFLLDEARRAKFRQDGLTLVAGGLWYRFDQFWAHAMSACAPAAGLGLTS